MILTNFNCIYRRSVCKRGMTVAQTCCKPHFFLCSAPRLRPILTESCLQIERLHPATTDHEESHSHGYPLKDLEF